jgi:predicted transcriptional regulator
MDERNRIVVEYGKMTEIAEFFNVTNAMVSKALRGKSNTMLAKKIRSIAIKKFNGREMTLVSKEQ